MGLSSWGGDSIFRPGELQEMIMRNALAQTQATSKDPEVLSSAARNAERNAQGGQQHDNQD